MRNDWGYKGSEVLSKLTEGNGISLNRSGSNENTGSSYAISIDKDEISKV
ncbi:hypothetical protein [Vallitalea guaymasensis]|nr:hypothetical protein [Vallitalea guaymasensis]